MNCDILFIGDINIVKDKCSNRYIRNMLIDNATFLLHRLDKIKHC